MITATYRVLLGDALEQLRTLPDGSVHCVVTSPPYFGLRDYGAEGQIGLEPTPAEYVARLVAAFREVKRVLRDDGTLWLNLGDKMVNKCLLGLPWQVAFALGHEGWILRSEIIWDKTATVLPESVTDRPHRVHETVFLFAKAAVYWYDAEAIRVPLSATTKGSRGRAFGREEHQDSTGNVASGHWGKTASAHGMNRVPDARGRHKPDVWPITQSNRYDGHLATFPEELIEPMILAGCPEGGTVLDPFAGSGTTLAVANRLGRHAIGIELNPDYLPLIERRCAQPGFIFTEVTP